MAHARTGRTLRRRTFLRGAGALIAVPLLDAMLPAAALAGDPPAAPLRAAFIFAPNGKHMPDWTPSTEGRSFELPALLEPLAPLRDHVQVLSGLTLDNARAKGDGPGDHARAASAFLTCAHPRKTGGADLRVGVSVDQVAAARIGASTRFPSLELGTEPARQSGECDSGYSCAYSSNISWRTESSPMGKETSPRLVFQRLFGSDRDETPAARARRLRLRKSILDGALGDARALAGKLGPVDRRKLEEYLTAVRELERRIEKSADGPARPDTEPPGAPANFSERLSVLYDLLVLAFRTDQTRIASFMVGNAGSNLSYRSLGVPGGHHQISHHGNDPKKQAQIAKINRYHVTEFGRFLAALRAVEEGDGTLLDHAMVVYGSAIGDGNRHNHGDLPILLAGGGGGTLTPGKHVRYRKETPLANLYLSMLDRLHVRVARHGDSTGRLEGI